MKPKKLRYELWSSGCIVEWFETLRAAKDGLAAAKRQGVNAYIRDAKLCGRTFTHFIEPKKRGAK